VTLLTIDALRVKLQAIEVLRGVSLTVQSGEMVGLVGRNGAGKTTTLRAVMGLVGANAGHISFAGQNLTALPTYRRAALGIGYMPEDRRLVPQLTVEENILLPSWATQAPDAASRLDLRHTIGEQQDRARSDHVPIGVRHSPRDLLKHHPLLAIDHNLQWCLLELRRLRGPQFHTSVGSRPSDDETACRANRSKSIEKARAPF